MLFWISADIPAGGEIRPQNGNCHGDLNILCGWQFNGEEYPYPDWESDLANTILSRPRLLVTSA
jgi:hypothetical protein